MDNVTLPSIFGNYSKLIGGALGNAIGILLVFLAMKVPSVATCTPDQACTLMGFTAAQVTGGVLTVFNLVFLYFFPPNVPSGAAHVTTTPAAAAAVAPTLPSGK